MLPLQRQQQVFHAPVGGARLNNRRTGDKELDDKVKKSVDDPQEGIREEKNLGAITGDPEQSSPSKRKPTTPGQGDECSKQRWTVQRRRVVRTFSLRTCWLVDGCWVRCSYPLRGGVGARREHASQQPGLPADQQAGCWTRCHIHREGDGSGMGMLVGIHRPASQGLGIQWKYNGPGPGLTQSTPSGVNIGVMKKDRTEYPLEHFETSNGWNGWVPKAAYCYSWGRFFFRKATLLYELIIRWLVVHKVSSVIRQPPLSP